jgi:hypothetical protein
VATGPAPPLGAHDQVDEAEPRLGALVQQPRPGHAGDAVVRLGDQHPEALRRLAGRLPGEQLGRDDQVGLGGPEQFGGRRRIARPGGSDGGDHGWATYRSGRRGGGRPAVDSGRARTACVRLRSWTTRPS